MKKSGTAEKGTRILIDRITVDGKQILLRGQDLPIEDVRLDPTNPRLANTVLADTKESDLQQLQQTLARLEQEMTAWKVMRAAAGTDKYPLSCAK